MTSATSFLPRLVFLVCAAAPLAGCASEVPRPAYPPEPFSPEPPADLSPGAAYEFRHKRVEVIPAESGGPEDFTLRSGDATITDREFGARYRDMTGSTEIDERARAKAVHENPKVIALGAGALTVGGGGLTLLAATNANLCPKDASGQTSSSCGKAVLGTVLLGVIAGVGVYTLGCEAIKGVDCLLDGNIGAGTRFLDRNAAERYAAHYDTTLANSLRAEDARLDAHPMPR